MYCGYFGFVRRVLFKNGARSSTGGTEGYCTASHCRFNPGLCSRRGWWQRHPESVAVFVTDIEGQMTMPDGSTAQFADSAGKAVFNPAGEHLPKNTSDLAWEVVEIELKPRDSATGEPDGPNATDVDADHYTTEFENETVRIVRIAYGPGEESVMHYHPDSVAVFVTDHLVQMTMADGSTNEISANAGDALFIPGGQHLPKNISDSAWELVLIELK
jgi:quercetin dioxygenase-like cupin family protein